MVIVEIILFCVFWAMIIYAWWQIVKWFVEKFFGDKGM